MRILYGVVGEGMGHAMRSRVVLDELVKRHDVHVVVSGRAHDYLKAREGDHLSVTKIWGYTMVYEDNEVQNFKTLLQNVKGAFTGGWPQNVRAYFEVAEKFEPDVVVSDFETWSYLFAKNRGLPVVSIDNVQMLNRCTHPAEVLADHEGEYRLAKGIVKAKLPGCFHYLITTFFRPPVRKPRTTLHPPVLRPEILGAKPEPGEHLLVYQTSTSNTALPDILKKCGRECRIYGLRRDITSDVQDANLLYRPFSEKGFIDDLRTAKGVVAGGGFTLMGEAVYLRRPMLSVPVKKQFEQILNAKYLELQKYGLYAEEVTGERLGQFVERLGEFERQLAGYSQDGNRDLLAKVDEVLAAAVASGQGLLEEAEP
jgi:uncharacterized protein (TIGR00661 family)